MKLTKEQIVKNQKKDVQEILIAKGEQDNREYWQEVGRERLANNEAELEKFKEERFSAESFNEQHERMEYLMATHQDITFFGISTTGLLGTGSNGAKDYVYQDEKGTDHIIKDRLDEPILFVAKTFTYDEKENRYRLDDFSYIPIEVTNRELISACLCDGELAKQGIRGKFDVFRDCAMDKDAYLSGIGVIPHDLAMKQIKEYLNEVHGDACNICYTTFHREMLANQGVQIPNEQFMDLEEVVRGLNREHNFLEGKRTTLLTVAKQLVDGGIESLNTLEKVDSQVKILEYLEKNQFRTLKKAMDIENPSLALNKSENTVDFKEMERIFASLGKVIIAEEIPEMEMDEPDMGGFVDDMADVDADMELDPDEEFTKNFGDIFAPIEAEEPVQEDVPVSVPVADEDVDRAKEDVQTVMVGEDVLDVPDYDIDEYDFDDYETEPEAYRQQTETAEKLINRNLITDKKETEEKPALMNLSVDYSKQIEGLTQAIREVSEDRLKAEKEGNTILDKRLDDVCKLLEESNKNMQLMTLLLNNFLRVYSAREIEMGNPKANTKDLVDSINKSESIDLELPKS